MGWDIAYHSISKDDLNIVISYCMGEIDDISDLMQSYARRKRNRLIVNHIVLEGIGLLEKSNKIGFLKKIQSKIFKKRFCKFDSWLHVWGRPFLVIENSYDEQFEVIQKFLNAKDDNEVLEILKKEIDSINPDLFKKLINLSEQSDKSVASEDEILESMFEELEFNKKIFESAIKKKSFEDINGNQHNPHELLTEGFQIISLLSHGNPAWMERGLESSIYTLISNCVEDYPSQNYKYIQRPSSLLSNHNKALKLSNAEFLPENYSLGIVVMPEDLNQLLNLVESHYDAMQDFLVNEGYLEEDAAKILCKIIETINYSIRSESIFVESTEIFSGPFGIVT